MRAVLRATLAARRSARPTAAENSLVSFFTLVAHRVIEWVKYGKNGALIGSTPPLEKGGIGGDFPMLPYHRRLKTKARSLRTKPTDAELHLWYRLRRKQ